ncbi:hypothetical protein roselon_01498 [Roseibacterium elongatum DSM 19469]|uniref:DUF2062 domain-containing protein n=1 Tax=Roseicyclus elongatus DSM 19469 TaxID=1294273 RepID=W8S4Z1_9RHOB|nr:hypothetical protein roselon_01498 [Roseibacterium elongatum DSM 19469]
MAEAIWPRGGWGRAFQYVQHRLRRLPGTPEQIARGVFAGTFTIFTPFFGLHFVVAALLAKVMRGSILAALLSTFLGNPLTYVPIAIISIQTGHFLLGTSPRGEVDESIFAKFGGAAGDLWHNIIAMFTPAQAHWGDLRIFYNDVFFPWMVGGVVPGLICALTCYYLSVSVIRAYQKRRASRLRAKMEKLSRQAEAERG